MYLGMGPLWIICNNYEDRVLQVLLEDIHGLQEVLLLQVVGTIQLLILQVVSSSDMDTHKLTRFLGEFSGLPFLVCLCSVISQDLFQPVVYLGYESLPGNYILHYEDLSIFKVKPERESSPDDWNTWSEELSCSMDLFLRSNPLWPD